MAIFIVPRDRVRRKRYFKRLTNIVLIVVVSTATAYVITRPVGGPGFHPSAAVRAALAAHSNNSASTNGGVQLTHAKLSRTSSSEPSRDVSDKNPARGGYKLPPGPYKVSEVGTIVLHDPRRNKDLHMRVFYPDAAGKYPVIVFSHGAGGSQDCCEELTEHWASYGYITIQPTHEDSALQRRNAGEENVKFVGAVREALRRPSLWESRPADISFVLNSLGELQKRAVQLSGKIDTQHVGVGGHSMGSFAAEAVAGATADLPGRAGVSFADARVKAALCLSPQGPGQFGLTSSSFATMRVPFMGITGSRDNLGPLASAAWHEKPFDLSPAGDKYFVNITGANHMSFISSRSLASGGSREAEEIFAYTNSAALAFWDAYLKNDAGAKAYLYSNNLARFSKDTATLLRK
jgi:predicted dienelactone hydrolase